MCKLYTMYIPKDRKETYQKTSRNIFEFTSSWMKQTCGFIKKLWNAIMQLTQKTCSSSFLFSLHYSYNLYKDKQPNISPTDKACLEKFQQINNNSTGLNGQYHTFIPKSRDKSSSFETGRRWSCSNMDKTLTWASAKQIRLITVATDDVASGGLWTEFADCNEDRTSWERWW